MTRLNPIYVFLAILAGAAVFVAYDAKYNYVDWRTANRSSAGIAPNPRQEKRAVVQVYTARTYNWRGYFAVHPWIAVKKKNQNFYTVYQVTAWNLHNGHGAVSIEKDLPDRYWYGNRPQLLQSLIGEAAEKAIPAIEKAAAAYPYADQYKLWPGPNSNSFVAYILRQVPELTVELPPTAIGKDFLGYTVFHAPTPSGTGYQVSILGAVSLTVGIKEGIELGILGLSFGLDLFPPAIKLPIIGRIGFPDI